MTITIKQKSKYTPDEIWTWSVWLDGPKAELDEVDHVVYVLHPSYNKPVRQVESRATNFRLDDEGWSSFRLFAEIYTKSGNKLELRHEVILEDVEPETVEDFSSERKLRAPKKLLSIDSGGVRSVISIRILSKIENILRDRLSDPNLVLADYFDYIGGTSTGAIIAAALSMGMSIEEIERLFVELAPEMFVKAPLLKRVRFKYENAPLANMLRSIFGNDTILGSDRLRTLLLIVLRNATTDEAWPLTNNPHARFNRLERSDSNLRLPLWQLIRASTAAPMYFPPEVIRVGAQDFTFVDGSITTYANPAMLLFLLATADPYRLKWPVGEKEMLLVSVGAGMTPPQGVVGPEEMSLLYSASTIPGVLIKAASAQQDLLCRMFGTCRFGPASDREVGNMIGHLGPGAEGMFTYLRYDPSLDEASLENLGLRNVSAASIYMIDAVENIPVLRSIGDAFANKAIVVDHLLDFS